MLIYLYIYTQNYIYNGGVCKAEPHLPRWPAPVPSWDARGLTHGVPTPGDSRGPFLKNYPYESGSLLGFLKGIYKGSYTGVREETIEG